MASPPTILVFDSGLGGLTVLREIVATRADAHYVYVADDAFFPYGHHSEEAIIAQKQDLGTSWGNLTVAHTLAASDRQGMTVAQVLQLHDRGMGWGQVAAALRFELNDAVRAVNAERRVARGLMKPDGKAAPIGGDGF